jgi:acetate---CoA ligase (ADP-forming)
MNLKSSSTTQARLDCLLRPRSIALVGASSTPGSFGESILQNLRKSGYAGELYFVNPKRSLIEGKPCLGSIEELPLEIDCAVLAIPASAVLDAVRACARKKVGSAIIFSAGFAESGETGKAAQLELARLAREHGIVIEGPNCLGMVNYLEAIPLTFVVTPPQARSTAPGVAIISQSGALAAVIAVNMRYHGISLTYSVSTGNEASHGVEDFLEHLIDEPHTRVLALVVEQFRNPKRFLELARQAQKRGKFIILLHPGSSNAARDSARTHTGAMAGDYQVMHALVTSAGVIHVESLEEFVDVAQILFRTRELPHKGVAMFTESGAFKAVTLDLCERIGLELPSLSPGAESALRGALPAFIPVSNPLDLTAQGLVDPSLYRRTLPAVLGDAQFGSVVLGIILTDPTTTALKLPPILDALKTLQPSKPVIFAALDEGAPFDSEGIRELRELGVPCFPSPERALRALAHVTSLGREQSSVMTYPPPRSLEAIEPGILPEYRSKALLKKFGIPVPQGGLAHNLDEAIQIAGRIGFSVVLKAQSADLPHKSDAGGVILSIESESMLAEGWAYLCRNIETSRPGLELEGVLVECMGKEGVELIFGARNDPEWGPVLLAGFGGVLAEAIRDVRLLPPDLSIPQFMQELRSLQCSMLFDGFRGSPALDVEAAAHILSALGTLMRCYPEIEEIDINPVVLYPKGKGAVALDALIAVGVSGVGSEVTKERSA